MDNKNCLTIDDIAKLTSMSIKSIRKEVLSKNLISKKIKNKYYINREDFNKWKDDSSRDVCNTKKKQSVKKCDKVDYIDISKEMETIDAWNNPKQSGKLNFIDLFSGAGGLTCGLVMAGLKPIGALEIMPEAVDTYNYNFSKFKEHRPINPCDIKDIKVKNDFIDNYKGKHINLIAGGFPCQGFSIAGNRNPLDPRNSLYKDMFDIVKALSPDYVLMENVEGLRTFNNGEVENQILEDYKSIGYNINVTTLNSADFGVAQIRRRVIFIANRIGKPIYFPKPIYDEKSYKTVGEELQKYLCIGENRKINHIFTKNSMNIQERIKQLPIGQSLYSNYSDAWKKVDWNKPSCTVKENHGGVNIHPILNRLMTPRELASLQSFPTDFIFKGAKKWQLVQIGNAVPCLLGKAIGLAIRKSYGEMK